MEIVALNHVAIYVRDVSSSYQFYHEKLGLIPIPRPAFTFPGAWFRLGSQQELHLIGNRSEEIRLVRQHHFALNVKSAAEAEAHLIRQGIPYTGPKPRPDGAIQIFIQDPDGYYIELFELKAQEQA